MSDFLPRLARTKVAAAGVPSSGFGAFYAVIAIVSILYVARDLLVPLALSVLLAFVLAPMVNALRRLGTPRAPSVVATVIFAFAVIAGLGLLMGQQLTELAAELPRYQYVVSGKLNALFGDSGIVGRLSGMLHDLGSSLTNRQAPVLPDLSQGPRPMPVEVHEPAPGLLELLQRIIAPLMGPVAQAGIVIVVVIFLLLYREDLRDRLIKLMGSRDLQRTTAALDEAAKRLSRFFLAQTAMNTLFGLGIACGLWAIGIPNPLLWGMVAGLMRFVPFVGSFIAVAFPALLAVAVDPGWSMLLWVLGLFAVGEAVMGQVAEPVVFGRSAGISPIAVLLATAFWAWLWGPVGLLLATPLTVGLVVIGRHVDQLEFLEVLLGDRTPLEPPESFYHRALAANADGLIEQAELALRETVLVGYYDSVAVPGLLLAQADASAGSLDRPRIEGMRSRIDRLMDDLSEHEDGPGLEPLIDARPVEGEFGEAASEPPEGGPPPEAWRQPGAVLCVAGRGAFDGPVSLMLAQVMQREGLGAQAVPNEMLRDPAKMPEAALVRAVCLCALARGTSQISLRHHIRRLRRRYPEAMLIIGLWGEAGDTELLAGLREEGLSRQAVGSLREATERVLAAATGQTPAAQAAA